MSRRSLECVLSVFARRTVASEWRAAGADDCRYTVAERTRTIRTTVRTEWNTRRRRRDKPIRATVSTVPGCARGHRALTCLPILFVRWCAEFNAAPCVYPVLVWRGAVATGFVAIGLAAGRNVSTAAAEAATTRAQLLYPRAPPPQLCPPLPPAAAANKWFARNSVRDARSPTRTPIAVVIAVCCLRDITEILLWLLFCRRVLHHSRGGGVREQQVKSLLLLLRTRHVTIVWIIIIISLPLSFCLDSPSGDDYKIS